MARMVKAAVLVEPERIELTEFPLPEVGNEDAVIRIERAGVCGTDPKLYRGTSAAKVYPVVLGHEILGRIEDVGRKMAARYGIRAGDRVVVEAAVPCGHCMDCQTGNYKFCRQSRGYGFTSASTPPHLWGAFSEFMYVAPNSVIHKIADHVSPRAAVVAASCLGNGIRWMRTVGGASIAKPVVIQGVGPQGLSAVVAAKEAGAFPIIVTGLAKDIPRLKVAQELGADVCVNAEADDVIEAVRGATNGELASTVLDVTGNAKGIALSVKLVKPLGTVVCGGTIPGGGLASIATNEIVRKEIRFQGVWGHSFDSAEQAIHLAERGTYPLEKLISHEFSLDQVDLAIRAMGREVKEIDPIKAAIKP